MNPTGNITRTTTSTTTSPTVIYNRKLDTSPITKLNGENYRVWKTRMKALLSTTKNISIVNGTSTGPRSGETQQEWDDRETEAFATLLACMEDSQVEAVAGCNTSNQIWIKLATIYENSSGENIQVLYMQYYAIMANESPVKAMCEIQNLANQLMALGENISDEGIVARVKSSMIDDKFRQIREAWGSVNKTDQTPPNLL